MPPRIAARRIVAAAALGVVAALISPLGAAALRDRAGNGGDLQTQIANETQAERAALDNIRGIEFKRASLDAQVADLDHRLSDAQATLAPLQAEADRLAGVVADVEARVAFTENQLKTARHQLAQTAAQMYRSARQGSDYGLILATSPDDLVKQKAYLANVSELRRSVIRRVDALRRDLDDQRRAADAEKAKADTAAGAARAARDQIAGLRAQLEPARAAAAAEQAAEQAALTDIQTRLGSDEAELASLEGPSDSIAALLRRRNTPGHIAPCDARPVPGPIISGYGPRRDPVSGASGFHPGVDMQATYGTPIVACRAGTIVIAGWEGGYGNAVVIDHGGGMATLYGHQSRLAVAVGDQVAAGQVIGYVGSTGYSTGPHLHFEVRIEGNTVDPSTYL
jgi:murein DD-endopeptidase MepM/ murein hydrolase activator NlpD